MDDLDRAARREPLQPVTARTDRRPIVAVVVAALVVLAIAIPKPWAPARPAVTVPTVPAPGSSDIAAGSAHAPSSPSPAGTPDAYAPLRTVCGSPGGWRAATLHRWPNRDAPIRTWSAIEPGKATGAEDPAVPFVDVVAAVTALGYCAPREVAAPDDMTADIWFLDADGEPLRLDPELSEPPVPHPLGGLWAAPPEAQAELLGVPAWRPGRYAIHLRGTAFDRWIGIEIREPPGPDDRPSPAAPPSPSASPATR